MALHFPALPKFDRLTALYRHRKSVDLPSESTSSPRLVNQLSMSLTTKGLLNPTGENNCFLNSAVQVLWHVGVFRRSFREVKGHHCIGKSCIFCSLKFLFTEFQHDTGHSAIPPDQLRESLARCYEGQGRFQLGLMDDAAECFEKLLEQVHYHLTGSDDMDTCSAEYCISHQKFALTILERTECRCGATSEPLSFIQFVHYISSSAFSKEAERLNTSGRGGVSFSQLVHATSVFGESRQCTNFAKCKQNVMIKRILLNSPDVFSLGLIWDSVSPSINDIMSVVNNIGLTLHLNEVFDHVFSDSAQCNELRLTAVIAYYGRHYSTFCYHSKLHEWIYFDDAKYRKIGADWSMVCDLIRKAHYQPLLLVYSNDFGENVSLTGAPTEVTLVSESSKELPTLKEVPEEVELTNEKKAAPVSTSATPSHTIDPMTFSIVPSGGHGQTQPQTQELPNADLMMFSVSPAVTGRPHPHAESAHPTSRPSAVNSTFLPTHSTPSHPPTHSTPSHPPTHSTPSHPHQSGQPQWSAAHTTHPQYGGHKSPSPTPSHVATPTTLTATQAHPTPSSAIGQSTARPRPHSGSQDSREKPHMRMKLKSQVSIEETKVQAQQIHYQPDDLMSFSIAPAHLPRPHPVGVSTSINGPGDTEHSTESNSDLIQFSISPQILNQNQYVSGSYRYGNKSHDSHVTSDLNPKWNHFSTDSSQQQTNFGMSPDQSLPKMGMAPDPEQTEHWALLTLSGSEKELDSSDLSQQGTGSATISPAVQSLRKVVSHPKQPAGKAPTPTGKVPQQLRKVPPPMGSVGKPPAIKDVSTNTGRQLPDIPKPTPEPKYQVSTNDERGTYVELDFTPAPSNQRSKFIPSNKDTKDDDHSEYSEIVIPSDSTAKSEGDRLSGMPRDSSASTPIGAHPQLNQQTKSKGSSGDPRLRHSMPSDRSHMTQPSRHVTPTTSSGTAFHESYMSDASSRDSSQPIGEDPLYAIPDQVKRKIRLKEGDAGALPESVKSQLSEARDLLAKAQSSRGSDDVVALMILAQYKSVLDKVLRDPTVMSSEKLSQQIRAKREEGARLYNELMPQKGTTKSVKVHGRCGRCGQFRELDSTRKLCGPCVLRVKISS